MKIAAFAVLALLSGCEMPPVVPDPPPPEDMATRTWRLLDTGLRGLYGQNIRAAITVWGYPTSNRVIVGDNVYNWDFIDQIPNVFGEPLTIACHIELAATQDGTIKSTRYDGNVGGCGRYANAFARQ